MKPAVRERNRPLRVVVSVEERTAIEANAAASQMTVSAFLRTLGLGHTPKSMLDQQAILHLVHAAGDQGRLGGLLKKWLADRPGEGASEHEVANLLRDVLETQQRMKDAVGRL